MLHFDSDYMESAHQSILQALADDNMTPSIPVTVLTAFATRPRILFAKPVASQKRRFGFLPAARRPTKQ